jgi:hypothetical protein
VSGGRDGVPPGARSPPTSSFSIPAQDRFMKFSAPWIALPAVMMIAATAAAQECACRGDRCAPGSPSGPSVRHYTCEEAYFQNSIWPRQYIYPARRGICESYDVMARNGWRRQNLLGPYHFEADGVLLNEAGRLKVEWILTQAPPQYRTMYVQRVVNQQQTAGRVEAVQQFVAELNMGGAGDVHETYVRDDGYPAVMVDAVFTGFKANQPVPALPAAGALQSSN